MAIRSAILVAFLVFGVTGGSTRTALAATDRQGDVDTAVAADDGERRSADAAGTRLPANVHYPASLRPTLDRMWQRSPTFRRQCARLSDAGDLVITLSVGLLPSHRRNQATAVTQIQMRGGRLARADVYLSISDLEKHIAHELEHIIERIDGVYVELMAARAMHGVERHDGAFETVRAQRTGQTVAREVVTAPTIAGR
jgi:hypothetical protein